MLARQSRATLAPMTTASPLERAARAWRAWALGLALAVAAVTTLGLIAAGEPPGRAARATAPVQAFDAYRGPASTDSLEPMLAAYRQAVTQPGGDLYSVFFKDHVKFQYPPSSLLLFDALPRAWTVGPPAADAPSARVARPMRRFWTVLCYLATVLTVLASAVALELRLRLVQDPAGPAGMSLREALGRLTHPIPWRGLALSGALGLVYYPLVAGYDLGNIQVVLGALAAVALLSQVLGRDVPSALCLGLCVLVKPQWGLVLLWALTRRRWRFAVVFLGVALVGTAVALARFGVHDHLRYLDVLGAIGGTGEVYWPNQSANGLVNRLLGNGDAIHWQSGGFAPPHPIVKAVTLLTSLAMLALALGRAGPRGGGHRRLGRDGVLARR